MVSLSPGVTSDDDDAPVIRYDSYVRWGGQNNWPLAPLGPRDRRHR